MTRDPTYCRTCEHVHPQTRKQLPTQWLCMKFPRLAGHGYVDPEFWTEKEPYMRCTGINGGACPLYRQRVEGQLEMAENQEKG